MRCETPNFVRGFTVPCGRCSACIERKRGSWVIRLSEEAKASSFCFFLTLTYTDENLIFADDVPVLWYDHLRLYHKKLRKLGFVYKYFQVGEYGERTDRPHYHMLVFTNQLHFDYQKFADTWIYGQTCLGSLTEASLKYCCKDMLKEVDLFYEVDKKFRPRMTVSHGMGFSYIENMKHYHKCATTSLLVNRNFYAKNEFKAALPRYFSDRIYNRLERDRINNVRKNDRSYIDILLAARDKQTLEDAHHEAQVYYQGVEQRKKKRLKIHHFGKNL